MDHQDTPSTWMELSTYLTNICGAWMPVLAHLSDNHFRNLCQRLYSESQAWVDGGPAAIYHYCSWSMKSVPVPNTTCQGWKQSFRWSSYHWNVGTWRFGVSLGWITPGDFLMRSTMTLGCLHRICAKWLQPQHIIDRNNLHMCHARCRNVWNGCLSVAFFTVNVACHVINTGLIVRLNSSFWCNDLCTWFVWIFPLVNTYIGSQMQSFICIIRNHLGW